MKQGIYTIVSNNKIAVNTFEMIFEGDVSAFTAPGQFLNIKLDGFFLRRPISVCDIVKDCTDTGKITIIYKTVGEGTLLMSQMEAGMCLDILTGLGNGYNIEKAGNAPLLIGGGAGIPPMYHLAKSLLSEGKKPRVILGFNNSEEIFYSEEFEKLLGSRKNLFVATADGTFGKKGFVTDVMAELDYSYFYTCGPLPMFLAIDKIAKTSGQFSFEERMGCGFGACMGCSCKTKYGNKRICKDGPVLEREEIIW